MRMGRWTGFMASMALVAMSGCGNDQSRGTSQLTDDVDPIDNDQGLRLILEAPGARKLPNGTSKLTVEAFCETGPACDRDRLFSLDAASLAPGEIKRAQKPLAFNSEYEIGLRVNDGTYWAFTIMTGKIVSPLVEVSVKLRRIDVNHMRVTRPDNSTYTAQGNANISVSIKDGWRTVAHIDTGTGLDVPQGFKYKVVVNAVTEDGPASYTSELDFTKS